MANIATAISPLSMLFKISPDVIQPIHFALLLAGGVTVRSRSPSIGVKMI
jgi:hypothetical protein